MTAAIWFLVVLIIAILADLWLMLAWRRYNQQKKTLIERGEPVPRMELWKKAMNLERFRAFRGRFLSSERTRQGLMIALELALIAVWAGYVGREYLDMNPRVIPAGREFSSAIQTHHLWTRAQECGWCALWNGSERGGYPAFADVHGSMLHPVVIATTLIWGVVNGAKVALVMSFWFAGVAQWWLARELRLGWLPRLWSAGMAVVGGHLTGRMELGAFGVVLSTAMCSLVFAGIVAVARGGGKKAAVLLGAVTASALISGQGYIQVGLIGVAPALVFLLFDRERKLLPVWKDFTLAFGIALLLAAPFLVPFLHFSPNFLKEVDPEFKSAQSLAYVPLNLVIDNWEFYNSTILGKFPYPHLYTLFIGWIPVVLAVLGLSVVRPKDRRISWFLGTGILLEFLIGSAVLLKWLAKIFPGVTGVRHPPQISGLAVPLILVLSAYGLDYLLNLSWPHLWMQFSESIRDSRWKLSLRWLLLIPLFFSLKAGFDFSKMWVYTERQSNGLFELLDGLETESLQWVNPPFGEHPYIEAAVHRGLKISPGIMTFRWKDREFPIAVLEANRSGPPPGPVQQIAEIDGVPIYERLDAPYAAVVHEDGFTPCTATGTGGKLDVFCDSVPAGILVVTENVWTGWKAWMDGERIPLAGDQWLEAETPAGKHTFQFRYRPWDVPLGLFFSLVGIILSVYAWRARPTEEAQPKGAPPEALPDPSISEP